jgi:hypothetical protein
LGTEPLVPTEYKAFWAPTAHLEALVKTNLLSLPGIGPEFLGSLACNLVTVPIMVPHIERKCNPYNFKACKKSSVHYTVYRKFNRNSPMGGIRVQGSVKYILGRISSIQSILPK